MAAHADRKPPSRNGTAKPAASDELVRRMPADLDAERGVIGSVMLLPGVLADVSLLVRPEDFWDDGHRDVFAALVSLAESGRPIDERLLVERLRSNGALDRLSGASGNGLAVLSRMINAVPNAAHAVYYAEIVREKARLRRLITACTDALTAAYDELPSGDVRDSLDSKLLGGEPANETAAMPIWSVWERVINALAATVGRVEPPALLSGLPSLDCVGLVFAPGELVILAARPGVGKTSLATQIAMHHASKGRRVLFASLEMHADALGSRVLMARAGINHQSVRTRGVQQVDIDQLRQAQCEAGELPLFVWAPGRVKVGAIRAMASALHARQPLSLLIVDYTSWVIPDDPRAQRRDQVGEIVKALRNTGQRLGLPVLLLHQLNREGANEKPQLTHLRESGCVEEDADIVAFIHPTDGTPPQVNLIVAKSRQGAKGEVPLLWHAAQTMFGELDDGPAEDRCNFEPEFAAFNQREFAP